MVASGVVASPKAEKTTDKATPGSGSGGVGGKKVPGSTGEAPSAAAATPGGGGGTGSHHRLPDTKDPILLAIAKRQIVLVQPIITLTCYIPSTSVGAVIGRR